MATRRKKTDVEIALKAVSETDIKKVLDQVGTVQTNVQSTLAALGVTLTEKIEELRNLETAIGARKDELADIHEIEVNADSLDEIQQKVEEADEDAQEQTKKRRKGWDDDRLIRDAAWTREDESHTYEVAQQDQRSKNELAAESTERQRQERFRMEDVAKRLEERIEAVEDREHQMETLETQVEAIDGRLETAVGEAKAEVTKQLTQGFSHERALLKKDADAATILATARVTALDQQNTDLQSRLEATAEQLTTARNDAREIANAAVEASSQRQVAASLQHAMDTQAQAPPTRR